MGYVSLISTCGEGAYAKTINVIYLIMDTMSPYNIIMGRLIINAIRAVISTQYLNLKYPLIDGRVGTIRGDQQVARECYLSIM